MKPFLLILIILLSSTAFGRIRYHIDEMDESGKLTLSLTRTHPHQLTQYLSFQDVSFDSPTQITPPVCHDVMLQKEGNDWIVPADCKKVSWSVMPKVALANYDASEQLTLKLKDKKWILLSEQAAFYRFKDERDDELITLGSSTQIPLLGATEISKNVWRVPSLNEAPEFYVVGDTTGALSSQRMSMFNVTYLSDNTQRTKALALEALHAKALNYLLDVLKPSQSLSNKDRHLLVIWLGMDDKYSMLGGAAGRRSFLVNYLYGSYDTEKKMQNIARSLLLISHEQFHQIVDIVKNESSEPTTPTWIDESLAQYYAIKAINAVMPNEMTQDIQRHFWVEDADLQQGLAEVERKFVAGDESLYPLFSTIGVTFWTQLDAVLRQQSQEKVSLDRLLPELLKMPFPPNGHLPTNFEKQVVAIGGEAVVRLIEKYIGN